MHNINEYKQLDWQRPYGKLYKSGYYHSLNRDATDYNKSNLIAGANNSNRVYRMNKKIQAKFVSRVINMYELKKFGLKTFILTYDHTKVNNPSIDNNKFLNNLRKNYKLNSYAWTLELTKKNQYHYHYIVDMPYTKVELINNAWNSARGYSSNNSVRAMKAIYKHKSAAMYAAKYFSKSKKSSEQYKIDGLKNRLYGTSNNIIGNETIPIPSYYLFDLLDTNSNISIPNEYTVSGYASTELTQFIRNQIENNRKITQNNTH